MERERRIKEKRRRYGRRELMTTRRRGRKHDKAKMTKWRRKKERRCGREKKEKET